MAAAVVKFNSLANAVWPAAENDHFLFLRGRRFVLFLVRGVKIWRVALEFSGAGIDALIYRSQFIFLAEMANLLLCAFSIQPPDACQASVGKAHAFGIAQHLGRNRFHRVFLELKLHVVNLFELVEEPRIDGSHLRQILYGVTLAQGVSNVRKPLGMRRDQPLSENLRFDFF